MQGASSIESSRLSQKPFFRTLLGGRRRKTPQASYKHPRPKLRKLSCLAYRWYRTRIKRK